MYKDVISRDIKIKFLNSILIFLYLITKKNWIKCSIKATKINVLKNKNPIYKIIDNVKNCFEEIFFDIKYSFLIIKYTINIPTNVTTPWLKAMVCMWNNPDPPKRKPHVNANKLLLYFFVIKVAKMQVIIHIKRYGNLKLDKFSPKMFRLKIGNRFLPGGCQSFNNSEAMAVKLKFEIWFVKLSLTKNVRASSSPYNSGFKNDNKDV